MEGNNAVAFKLMINLYCNKTALARVSRYYNSHMLVSTRYTQEACGPQHSPEQQFLQQINTTTIFREKEKRFFLKAVEYFLLTFQQRGILQFILTIFIFVYPRKISSQWFLRRTVLLMQSMYLIFCHYLLLRCLSIEQNLNSLYPKMLYAFISKWFCMRRLLIFDNVLHYFAIIFS